MYGGYNMWKIFKDSFLRNIAIVLLVTLLAGALFSAGIASAANFYFGETLQGLIGDFGEYDLILSVRQPTKELAAKKLQEIITERLPGVKWKEGIPIPGKANFFLSFPDRYKKQEVWENLDQYFSDIPGKSGWTIMLEPRLTIRGIPVGAQGFILKQLKEIPEVEFVFKNGSGLELVLEDGASVPKVSEKAKKVLARYALFTVYFPLGYKPDDAVGLGKKLAYRLEQELKLTTSQNVTFGGVDRKTASFTQTLGEMRSFLLAYASQISLELSSEAEVQEKDQLLIENSTGSLILNVTKVSGHTAQGILIQGQAHGLLGEKVYQMDAKGKKAGLVGRVTRVENPKEKLNGALDQSVNVLNQLDGIRSQAQEVNQGAKRAVEGYNQLLPKTKEVRERLVEIDSRLEKIPTLTPKKINLDSTIQSLNQVESQVAGTVHTLDQYRMQTATTRGIVRESRETIQAQLSFLPYSGADEVRFVLENSLQVLLGLEKAYQQQEYLLTKAQANLAEAQDTVKRNREGLEGLQNSVNSLHDLNAFRTPLQNTISSLDQMTGQLERVDVIEIGNSIGQLEQLLDRLATIDQQNIINNLNYLQLALPRLEDQEIGNSVTVMDDYLTQQVAIDQGLIILTDSSLPKKEAERIARATIGNPYVSTLTTQVGGVDADIRGEIQRIITQIREILAALSAIAFTLLILILDQTTIMSSLAVLREEKKKSWWGEENLYGVLVGAFLLTTIVALAQGAIPYLSLGHFALIGALLGFLISLQCQTLSPVNSKEVIAGQALGLSYGEVMEQIVIPTAKPGFLKLCNQQKVRFRGKGGRLNAKT